MSTVYDKKTFVKIFDSFRVHDEIAEIIKFFLSSENDLMFTLYISPYDEYAVVMLKKKGVVRWIFDVCVENLDSIVYEESSLKFYRKDGLGEPAMVVVLEPAISLSCYAVGPEGKP